MAKGELLGEFELYIMLALAHVDRDAYGIAIRREIVERTGRDAAIGAVYATLARLEAKGLVRHTLSAPQPIQGGRARKCFHLTAAGERALAESTAMLTRMLRGWRPKGAN